MVNLHCLTTSLLVSFLLLLYSFDSIATAEAKHLLQLERGHSLSVEDADSTFLTSPDNTFACGFYGLGSNAYWFAIWFTNSRDKTVVWVANRRTPVNRRGSKMSLRKNGALTLTGVDGKSVWETSTSATSVNRAELLETGNLVLKNPEGDVLWQSFGFPTDTLLPSQVFTKDYRLISPLRKGSFEPGYFRLFFDGDNVLKLVYDNQDVSREYWPDPYFDVYTNERTNYNGTRIAFLDNLGRFFSTDRKEYNLYLNASDAGPGKIKRRMKLDIDGNLRIYSLDDSTGLWKITWQALQKPCGVHGICGGNAICNYGPEPKCSCPPGHVMINSSDWGRGCKALFNITDLIAQPVKFLEISHVDYWGFDLNYSETSSLEDCRAMCLEDEGCVAFTYWNYGERRCFTKNTLFNGYRSPDFQGSAFLKLPQDLPVPESGTMILNRSNLVCAENVAEVMVGSPSMYEVKTRNKLIWVYLYSFCFAIGGVEVVAFVLGWWALFSKHGVPASIENGYCMLSSQFRRFTYAELKKATKNFKVELGRGGSGAVYKGGLEDGRALAVKRLGDEFQGEEQFWAEITTIGKINHMYLVRMWGFCAEGKHRLLVYEYVQNSSLDKHIYTSDILGWKERFEVGALGTAKGLAYLHHECLEWVIHCDVKPENILVTSDLEPKIADFGLAKLAQRGDPGSYFTKIRGTKGYMAPEWALSQPITAKVDVYGYGVVILEMVNGNRLISWVVEESGFQQEADIKKFFWAMKRRVELKEERWVDEMVDKRLEGKFSRKQAKTMIKVGLACVEEDRKMRPTMASVAQMLLECQD